MSDVDYRARSPYEDSVDMYNECIKFGTALKMGGSPELRTCDDAPCNRYCDGGGRKPLPKEINLTLIVDEFDGRPLCTLIGEIYKKK